MVNLQWLKLRAPDASRFTEKWGRVEFNVVYWVENEMTYKTGENKLVRIARNLNLTQKNILDQKYR